MKNTFRLDHFHQALDRYFGLPTLEVEQTAEQLHSEGLLTSYLDYYQIFHWLQEHQIHSLTDIGAGLGRSLLCASKWFSSLQVRGIENDPQRVAMAQSAGVTLIEQDCQSYFSNPNCAQTQSYYLYFPWGPCLYPFLKKLKGQERAVVIVTESYGDFLTLLKVHAPWLKKIDEIPSVSQRQSQVIEFFQVDLSLVDLGPLETKIVTPEQLAAWFVSDHELGDFRLHIQMKEDSFELGLDEVEIAYYPDQGFTLERLRPRRLYWWRDLQKMEILPRFAD